MLAGGLHAILAERELRRRLALAQQRDAVAQALGELAGVEIARLHCLALATLGTGIACQVRDERRHALAFVDGLRFHLELRAPALEKISDESELALRELVRIAKAHQHGAGVGDARRGVLDIA